MYTLAQFKKDLVSNNTPNPKNASSAHMWFKFKYRTADAIEAMDTFIASKGVARHLKANQEQIKQLEIDVNIAFKGFLMTCGLN